MLWGRGAPATSEADQPANHKWSRPVPSWNGLKKTREEETNSRNQSYQEKTSSQWWWIRIIYFAFVCQTSIAIQISNVFPKANK